MRRRSAAQVIAADARNRLVRRPHVTDGMPSETRRSTVAVLTPMIRASSARETYRSTTWGGEIAIGA
jgi:hypothetical protein